MDMIGISLKTLTHVNAFELSTNLDSLQLHNFDLVEFRINLDFLDKLR